MWRSAHRARPYAGAQRLQGGIRQCPIADLGDMTAIAALQFSHPEAGLTFDVDSAMAPETRRRVLDKLATDKLAVAGSHLPFPGFGHVETKAGAFAWVPEEWSLI